MLTSDLTVIKVMYIIVGTCNDFEVCFRDWDFLHMGFEGFWFGFSLFVPWWCPVGNYGGKRGYQHFPATSCIKSEVVQVLKLEVVKEQITQPSSSK